jgi:hypothetical protein
MPLRAFQTITYYDPSLDGEAVKVTGFSGHGAYTVTLLKGAEGRERRQQKEVALDAIEDAIEAGDAPGEVSKARVVEAEERWKLEQGQVK